MKIGLIGYGKMGQIIGTLAEKQNHEIVFIINSENSKQLTPDLIKQCDVCIEFSTPQTAVKNLITCFEAKVPAVCGTTGWYETLPELATSYKDSTLFYASNFSIGVNLMFAINNFIAGLMHTQTSYKVSMQEIHHLQKKDMPSGTAITLAQDVLASYKELNGYAIVPDLHKLFIDCVRAEGVIGTHLVQYQSEIDEITLTHKAFNRQGFAQGALLAANWIIGKKGFYTMRDMLHLNLR